MNKITYHKEGDYLIPDLYLPKQPEGHIGKYGRLRLNYLKSFYRGLYNELLIDGTLKQYLLDIDENANTKVNLLIKQLAESENINELAKKENVDENLKQNNQLEWVRCMNNIKNRAEEIVLNELIYC